MEVKTSMKEPQTKESLKPPGAGRGKDRAPGESTGLYLDIRLPASRPVKE
jgi:hypothetical protein